MDSNRNRPHAERIAMLEQREAVLLVQVMNCIPPVDQHRADLERIRSELNEARATRG